MYNALVQSMANGMMKELEQGIVDDELDSKYKKLSQIVGAYEGQKDIKAWRPPGDISQHIRSHLAAEKLKMKEELEKIVKTGDVEIYLLQQDVLKKRAMARNLGDRITSLMNQMYSEGNKVNDFYNYQNRICEILLEHV
ncbi:uncharacterized protein [Anabrus simplex]|uniref:uncharacterized protein n=1 Tax=Anabrus simplex TaxID=316456 RepID=UPI0034DDB10D